MRLTPLNFISTFINDPYSNQLDEQDQTTCMVCSVALVFFTLGAFHLGSAIYNWATGSNVTDLTDSTSDLDDRVSSSALDIMDPSDDVSAEETSLFEEKVESGTLTFAEFTAAKESYTDMLGLILSKAPKNSEGNPELTITEIADKQKGTAGVMKLVVKKDPILDDDEVRSQLSDPLYRRELLKRSDQDHYSFEFFDVARNAEREEKMAELDQEQEMIGSVTQLFAAHGANVAQFNQHFTKEQRAYYGVAEDKQLTRLEITQLDDQHQEKLFMFPFTKASIEEEYKKATIRGRFSADGSIGELKSVNIHSPILGGAELMNVWDQFCSAMKVRMTYLEDDAKIEGETGSYNLRLFRLMALNKTSWYQDGYEYHPYVDHASGVLDVENAAEQSAHNIQPFKGMKVSDAHSLLSSDGFEDAGETLAVLAKYSQGDDVPTLGELVGSLGSRVRKGEELHKEVDLVLNAIKLFSSYNGSSSEIQALKTRAGSLANERFYRKDYQTV